jgi:hypothetical protein
LNPGDIFDLAQTTEEFGNFDDADIYLLVGVSFAVLRFRSTDKKPAIFAIDPHRVGDIG